MKPSIFFVTLAISTLAWHSLRAQTILTGTQLELGPSGSDQVTFYNQWGIIKPANYSGAMGEGNTVTHSRSLAIGIGNWVGNTDALAVGNANAIGRGFPNGGWASFAVGLQNYIHGDRCFAMGARNSVKGWDYDWVGASDSIVIGMYNHTGGVATAAIGSNNYIYDENDDGQVRAAALFGHGLVGRWSQCVVVGSYNDSDIPFASGLRFAVGSGTDSSNRSNAFEVYADGRIEMGPQGDISMGEFGE